MTASERRRRLVEDPADLPLLTHEFVLGGSVAVSQKDIHDGEYRGGTYRENSVEVKPWGMRRTGLGRKERRYLAEWARRVLFPGGATPA